MRALATKKRQHHRTQQTISSELRFRMENSVDLSHIVFTPADRIGKIRSWGTSAYPFKLYTRSTVGGGLGVVDSGMQTLSFEAVLHFIFGSFVASDRSHESDDFARCDFFV